jgi:hypothetical protein
MSIHLDTTRNPSQQEAIVKRVMDAPPTCAIILFSSPQALVNCALWRSLLFRLLRNRRLKLVCIDEIHLFAQFGLWFRSEFFALRDALFKHLLVFDRDCQPHRTRVPILGMTATANALLLRWGRNAELEAHMEKGTIFDVILGADLIYGDRAEDVPKNVRNLFTTVCALLVNKS